MNVTGYQVPSSKPALLIYLEPEVERILFFRDGRVVGSFYRFMGQPLATGKMRTADRTYDLHKIIYRDGRLEVVSEKRNAP